MHLSARDPIPALDPESSITTISGTHRLHVKLANGFWTRFKGLMLTKAMADDAALLLAHCNSVHTAFMRFPIDVLYLDKSGCVVKCVPHLKPWRGSFGKSRHSTSAVHCLELTAGSIARLQIQEGDWLAHPYFVSAAHTAIAAAPNKRQAGSAMVEFTIVGPIITLLGLGILQYGMLFFAKNNFNHAAFMAARAGSVANASLSSVREAYIRALIPLYGGGSNPTEIAAAYLKAQTDLASNLRIELLNPTKESFDDWSDPALQDTVGKGKGKNNSNARVIPNGSLASRDPSQIKPSSGQSIQDANLIKLRVTQGYEPKIPFIKSILKTYLQWQDTKVDSFHTAMVADGRIPMVTYVTLQMQSDAIEPDNPVSSPGHGNGGNPTDPPVVTTDPPKCATVGCTVEPTPTDPGGACTGPDCPICGK